MPNNKFLKNKKILLATWCSAEKDHYSCRDWKPILEKLFGKVITFSPRNDYFKYGKEIMNKNFLDLVEKEKPDFILFGLSYDEFFVDTFFKIKELSPNTITLNFFGDDNWRYDDWSRYYALFFDYFLVTEKDISDYTKDGFSSDKIFFFLGFNPEVFKQLKVKKEYDVTFIGMPIRDRYQYIKFLLDNGIKIKLFGPGWDKYSDLKEIYGGFLPSEDYIKTLNQTKININFSKTILQEKGKKDKQLKGRILEVPACKSFILIEQFEDIHKFLKNTDKITFNNKHELLSKVKYYLEHEQERDALAKDIGNQVVRDYSWESQFIKIFKSIKDHKHPNPPRLPEIKNSLAKLSVDDLKLTKKEIKNKVKNADYISFETADSKFLDYKDYFQVYSLEKSKKKISCCDYYLYSKNLGDYMHFTAKKAFKILDKKNFDSLIVLPQLTVKKNFFLQNLKKFKLTYEGRPFSLIKDENTVFISTSLVRVNSSPVADYDSLTKSFRMLFLEKLYSLFYQKKIASFYPAKLILFSLTNNPFIYRYLIKSLLDKQTWSKLKK